MSVIDRLKNYFSGLGSSEGSYSGPRPGQGAVVHHSSGNADFDGLVEIAIARGEKPSEQELLPREQGANQRRRVQANE
jgi:hypothetical protein